MINGDLDGKQLKAARALLGWSQGQLAAATGLSIPTITRAEGQTAIPASPAAVAAIRAALEAAGVEFLPENGHGPGVRLVKR